MFSHINKVFGISNWNGLSDNVNQPVVISVEE